MKTHLRICSKQVRPADDSKISQQCRACVKTRNVDCHQAHFTAEDAEVCAKDAEKNCPLRTSASASASSAFKRVASSDSSLKFDTRLTAGFKNLPPRCARA